MLKMIAAVCVCFSVVAVGVVPVVAHDWHIQAQQGVTVSTNDVAPPTVADIRARDNLVFAQESLLNSYRCRFGIDTGVVPGGCRDGKPARTVSQPPPFAGQPTALGVAERERLIYAQEWQLNSIRCRFGVDTVAVPDGCQQLDMAVNSSLQQIVVPSQAPSGRCASYITSSIYAWESDCAWGSYYTNQTYNYPLSDGEAAGLLRQIWEEVKVAGKPPNPPTAALVPSGTRCASGGIIGCYNPATHHINRLDAFLRVLLHEAAHALIADHPTISACSARSGDAYQTCVHNDLFRCVADHLYVAYGKIPTSGACGTVGGSGTVTPQPTPRPTSQPRPLNNRWVAGIADGNHYAAVEHALEDASLVVRCQADSEDVEVFVVTDEQLWHPSTTKNGAYMVIPADYWDMPDAARSSYRSEHSVWVDWESSTIGKGIFASDYQTVEDLVNLLRLSELPELIIWSQIDVVGDESEAWIFPIQGAASHVDKVIDQCGWVEEDDDPTPAPIPTPHPTPRPTPTPAPVSVLPFSFQVRCTKPYSFSGPQLEVLWNAGQSNFDYETRDFDIEVREISSGRSVETSAYIFKSSTDWERLSSTSPNSGQTYEMRAREDIDYRIKGSWSAWATSNRCP